MYLDTFEASILSPRRVSSAAAWATVTKPDGADCIRAFMCVQVNTAIRDFVVNNQAIFAPHLFGDTRNVEFVPLAKPGAAA